MLSDDEVIARAIENGWRQMHAVTDEWPGSPSYPWTGWLINGCGVPVKPGEERDEWVGTYPNRHKVTYVDSWARIPRERLSHDDRCGECGKRIEYGGFIGMERERAPLPHCWHCQFWLDRIPLAKHQHVVASLAACEHVFVSLGPHRTPSSHNGYGGAWFTLTLLDGTTVRTCDLWNGGEVPERFRDRLPITATVTR